MAYPIKLLLCSNNVESLRFIKEALIPQKIEIVHCQLNETNKFLPDIDRFDLVILDTSIFNVNHQNFAYSIIQNTRESMVPLLVLVKQEDVRLRYRLMEMGADDYLTVPFDQLDVQTRVKNLVKYVFLDEKNLIKDYSSSYLTGQLKEISQLLETFQASLLKFDLDNFFSRTLNTFYALLGVQQLLYFQSENNTTIFLKYAVPSQLPSKEWKIPIDELPTITKSVRLKKVTILNQINPENILSIYFKSYLSENVKAIALHPVVVENQTQGLLLAIRTDDRKFLDTHYRQIECCARILGIAIQVENVRIQLKEKLDVQLWKYSYRFLEQVINQLNFGILVVDHHHKIRYLNQSAADLLKVTQDKTLYNPLEKILGKQNTDIIFKSAEESEGAFERPEIMIKEASGEKILIGFNTTKFYDQESGETGYIISLKDITYSKELQEEMRRMDRLASLGVMASGIAHEIRNPLAGIKAIAQTFEEELAEDDPKNEFVRRIIKQVNRLDDLLKTLFSYAKPQKPNRQFYQIDLILQEVLALLKQKLQQHNVKLTQSFASNVPRIFVDSSQIQQVLFNLILNSIEAVEQEGEIHISVDPIQGEFQKFSRKPFYRQITGNPYVLIHISDTGCGISKEDLQKIFNPFFTTKSFGTGLGLSIVFQIVKENNGIIYFESEEQKGTNCYLFLPAFDSMQKNGGGEVK